MTASPAPWQGVLEALGIVVLERGWLSSNNILFLPAGDAPATVVDTGYSLHAPQTVQLIRAKLGSRALGRVINTHLHSDHCGGNRSLQGEFGAETWVPAASFDSAKRWDVERLSFERTDQVCERFEVHRAIDAGAPLRLGAHEWSALSTPGHDPDALVYFHPGARILISGDALWQDRLAVVFPELVGGPDGFAGVRRTLDLIESLRPALVIPGHGPPFAGVDAAIAASRQRLESFERAPERHLSYALRALVMFHMLERREVGLERLTHWMANTPILRDGMLSAGQAAERIPDLVDATIVRLLRDGALERRGTKITARANSIP